VWGVLAKEADEISKTKPYNANAISLSLTEARETLKQKRARHLKGKAPFKCLAFNFMLNFFNITMELFTMLAPFTSSSLEQFQTQHTAATPQWMGASPWEEAQWVMVGLPYDGTTSYRPGTRFGPAAAREASWGVETYDPLWHLELGVDVTYADAGELELPFGNRSECLNRIGEAAESVLDAGKKWFGIGGEHLVTLPAFNAVLKRYPNLAILHFDAHTDLRDDYLGEQLSHATVLRRCAEQIDPAHFVQIGIRSGTREEWDWMRQHGTIFTDITTQLAEARARLEGRPVFVTLDLDVLDPSILPGTGTPEPGGLSYKELSQWLLGFRGINVVAADVVELSPHYDNSGVSSVVAAKVIRQVLLLAGASPKG
jgi:agmatinase